MSRIYIRIVIAIVAVLVAAFVIVHIGARSARVHFTERFATLYNTLEHARLALEHASVDQLPEVLGRLQHTTEHPIEL